MPGWISKQPKMKPNLEALAKLAWLMDHIDTERENLVLAGVAFNFKIYCIDAQRFPEHATEPNCKWAACAIGHAMLHPWFIKRGLACSRNARSLRFPLNDHEFFGLDDETYRHLFMPQAYPQGKPVLPKDVAKRIRATIAKLKKK